MKKKGILMEEKEMRHLVPEKLRQIEAEFGIKVLFAAESGSRAWGTASQDSDYDVRFIYIRPREDYLRLEGIRDVLEFPIADGWDMCGWDLSKTLRLLHNSNSQIYDWINAPIVYMDDGFSRRFRPVMAAYFSLRTVALHYLHQVLLRLKKQLKGETVKVKQYLYAVQYLLAAQWTLETQAPPPVSFRKLMEAQLAEEKRAEVEAMLAQKITHPDQPWTERTESLDAWLEAQTQALALQIAALPEEAEKGWEELNRFFQSELERQ